MKRIAISALILACCGTAMAVPQHNPAVDPVGGNASLWSITFYDDTSASHGQWATQNICMLQGPTQGSNTTGLWYSTTYNRWIGRWRQEGDQVAMIGDFWDGRGKDAMRWELVTAKAEGFGHWEEWVEDGTYGNWLAKGNTKLVRLGECTWKPPVGVTWAELERLALEEALRAPKRLRADGSEAYPGDRAQLPLPDRAAGE